MATKPIKFLEFKLLKTDMSSKLGHLWLFSPTLVTRVEKKIILYTFCPSPPLCNVGKTHRFAFYHFPALKWGIGVLTLIL